jgi:hypothetical protein
MAGINVAQYQIPRFSPVVFGTYDGSLWTPGLREPGTISRKGDTVNSVQFPVADLHKYDVAFTFRQTRFLDFQNAYSLVASGPHQLCTTSVMGQNLAFTDNDNVAGANFTNPVGSALLGGNISFTIGQGERQLDYRGHTMMAQSETAWMLASSPATPVTGSGSEIPYASGYNRGNFRRRGIAYISIAGTKYQIFSGSRFNAVTHESEGESGKDFRERPYPSMLTTDFTSNILCTDSTSLANLNTAEQTSVTNIIGTWNDETITWNAGASSFWIEDLQQGERGYMAKIHIKAELPMVSAAIALSPTSMNFSLVV